MTSKIKIKLALSIFIIASMILIYARLVIGGGLAGGDSIQYYSHLQSVAVRHTLNFDEAFNYFHNTKSKFTGLVKYPDLPDKNPATNKYSMLYPIGTLISWLPFFLIGHLVALVVSLFSSNSLLLSGFSRIHYFFTSSSALFYLLAACYLAYRYLVKFEKVTSKIAFLSVATIALGSSLTYYVYFVPTYSHVVSFFWSTCFLVYSLEAIETKRLSARNFFIIGLLLAMTTLVRYQDILVSLVPLYFFIFSKDYAVMEKITLSKKLIFTVLAFVLLFVPQLLVNHYLQGSFLQSGYGSGGFLFLANPQLIYVLFSPLKGLFVITPVVVVALIGLLYNYKSHLNQAFLLLFASQLYLISAWVAYHQGESYGIRMMISLSFVFMLGLVKILTSLNSRKEYLPYLFSFTFIALNWTLMVLFAFRIFGSPYGAEF